MCCKGIKLHACQKVDRDLAQILSMTILVGNVPLANVSSFDYLGWILTLSNEDLAAVQDNIRKAWGQWAQLACVLTREGATSRVSGIFYKAEVQAVLLYGSETWCITTKILKLLQSFHDWKAQFILGIHIRCNCRRVYQYPDQSRALQVAGLYPIKTYLGRR